MYAKVPTDMNFAAREKETAAFWKENSVEEKSFHLRDGAEKYTFYDGPPTANGKPHIGHVLTRVVKDLIPRYHTMKGRSVLRKAGWDTHGLPVELEVEKQLGLNGKQQIEQYGIEPFIAACKQSVWKYLNEWEEMSQRVGFWLDMEHPYVTYKNEYIESVWWSIRAIADKGLLYRGHKVVPYCPRCGTTLSSHEVAQGYRDVTENSAYVRFAVKGRENTWLLAWTTTPWTLPSNVALCVNAREEYCELTLGGDTCIMARALIPSVFAQEELPCITVTKTFRGEAIRGLEYEPLFALACPREKAWYVVADDFVTLEEGTGIVHIAPAFGEDDARVGRDNGLPFVQLVNPQGKFIDGTPWSGIGVKEADAPILQDLKARGLLLKKTLFTHSYPFCWRCDTPLIYYARNTWFIRMTAVKENLIRNNRAVNWMPDNIKEGRMGNFLENVVDWGLSRERYWGTPLPIWLCEDGHMHVVGSIAELREMSTAPLGDIELHRPFIDAVTLRCPSCGKEMRRVKEVIDCWYDSGSMPFAQWHYPFEHKEEFESNFPADFISEAVDQTRGWFYTLLAIGTLLFDRAPFESCLVLGHVQDKDGRKMSKHLGNVVDPKTVLDKQGADAVRWYFFTAGAPWLPSRFYEEAVGEAQRKFMGTLQNTYAFFILYADIDGFDPRQHPLAAAELSLMDRWILSRLNSLVSKVDADLAQVRIPESARAIGEFTDVLSNWYVRRGRERFWGKGMAGDKEAAFITLYTVLETLCRLIAPFVPFMAEAIYQNLVRTVDASAPVSVHLTDFPVCDEGRINPDIETQMDALVSVVQLGRACRNLASMKVRQPASAVYVKGAAFDDSYADLARDELNVKKILFTKDARAFTGYKLKPQLRTLGPRYGKLLGKISQRLQAIDGSQAVDAFERGECLQFEVDGTPVTLAAEDVLVESTRREGFMSQEDRGVTVVLDTNLTEDLVAEGYAREVISKLQTMRKDTGFEVTDRIHVAYQAGDRLSQAIEKARGMIMGGVLAASLSRETPAGEAVKEWDINGETAVFGIARVAL
jgi:isoleucyl-tRNA synthetase